LMEDLIIHQFLIQIKLIRVDINNHILYFSVEIILLSSFLLPPYHHLSDPNQRSH
jgi:hypothetical protein